jgi:protein involved in polysaccharide export with SLBB domain
MAIKTKHILLGNYCLLILFTFLSFSQSFGQTAPANSDKTGYPYPSRYANPNRYSFKTDTTNKTDTTKLQPTLREIIKGVEDTIGIEIDNLGINDIDALKKRALELKGVDVDKEISTDGGGGNEQGNQQGNKQLIEEVKEATEKVEKLVETASDELRANAPEVDIFGFEYIQEREVRLFNSALDVKPPDHYILGPGDEINVNIWGYSDYNEVFVIEKEGYIQPRLVGRIYLKGLTVADARQVMISKFGRVYDLVNSQFDIAINYSRVITVNISGEVLNPGSYTLPAVNSAFNILAYMGGPSPIGSLRNIQVIRDGQIVERFDLYKFLFFPELQKDIFLQNNDYLFVPLSKKVVEIVGEVKRTGKYELLEIETYENLLEYAAGYNPQAFTKVIQIQRYENNKVFIMDIDLDSLKQVNGVLPLRNGDQVRIRKIPYRIENYVKITGPIYLPGQYEWKEGYRVSDLIRDAGGFIDQVHDDEAYITRYRKDFTKYTIKLDIKAILAEPRGDKDLLLEKQDEIELFAKTYFADKYQVSIDGAVRNPRTLPMQDGMSVRDLIILSGGLEKYAYLERGYITRVNKSDNSYSYLYFPVDTANNMAALDQYILNENDIVFIMSNLTFTENATLSIKGAVKMPGTFQMWKEFSLKDLILISGGLIENVYIDRAFIFRKYNDLSEDIISVKVDTSNNMAALDTVFLQRNDEVRIFSNLDYYESFLIEVNGEVKSPKTMPFRNNMRLSDAVLIAGGLKFSASNHRIEIARVSNFEESVASDVPIELEIIYLDLTADLVNDANANTFMLQPFDQIFVRKTAGFDFQQKVTLSGEFKYPGEYVLQNKNQKLTEIIERAGGLTEYAFVEGIVLNRNKYQKGNIIMEIDKAIRRPQSKFNYILREGDEIIAPTIRDLVSITGTIGYPYMDKDSVVHVAHFNNKRAGYYVRNYGVGFEKNSKKRDTYVVHANGLVSGTKTFFGAKIYPKVDRGSTIHVPSKTPKIKEKRERDKSFSPLRLTETLIATTSSALTFYLLIDRVLE